MKFFSLALALFPISLFAFSPSFTSIEVKISYPCGTEAKLNYEKVENEIVSFYDGNGNPLYRNGLILRKRKGASGGDYTAKYRATGNTIDFDKALFDKLANDPSGKLKCEIDMVYAEKETPRATKSCSFKTEESALSSSHLAFINMTKTSPSLKDLKEFKVASTEFKLKLSDAQKRANPFLKKPSVEKWETRGECKLEVSGKFDITGVSEKEIIARAQLGLKFIQELVPVRPSAAQGNKTSWALGLSGNL